MIERVAWIVLVLGALACSKDKDKGEARPAAANKAPADAAKQSPAELFTGTTVTMPAHVAKLAYGMPEADARAAHPDVFAAKYGYKPPGFDGVKTNVQFSNGRLYQTRIEIEQPIETVKQWVTAKWGPPTWETTNSIGSPEIYWDAPDAGLRMKLEKMASNSMVRFDPVTSTEAELGTDPKTFGFEKVPLLGATPDAILQAYAADRVKVRDDDPGAITFSTVDLAGLNRNISVTVRVKDGKVTGYTATFPPQINDKLVPRLEAIFGPRKPASVKMYTDFEGPLRVKAQIRDDVDFSTIVWVGDYKK